MSETATATQVLPRGTVRGVRWIDADDAIPDETFDQRQRRGGYRSARRDDDDDARPRRRRRRQGRSAQPARGGGGGGGRGRRDDRDRDRGGGGWAGSVPWPQVVGYGLPVVAMLVGYLLRQWWLVAAGPGWLAAYALHRRYLRRTVVQVVPVLEDPDGLLEDLAELFDDEDTTEADYDEVLGRDRPAVPRAARIAYTVAVAVTVLAVASSTWWQVTSQVAVAAILNRTGADQPVTAQRPDDVDQLVKDALNRTSRPRR